MTAELEPEAGDLERDADSHRLASGPVAAIGATLVVHNVLIHRVLPRRLHSPARILTTGVLVALSRAAGASERELGLSPETFGRGARYGTAAAAVVGAGITAAMLVPAGRRYFARGAPAVVSKRRVAYETVFRIPWMTAGFEEMAFRGVLYGLLEHRFSARTALTGSTVAFAAWHVLPALPGAGGVQDTWETPRPALAVMGSVVATGAAGLAFGWLRARSGSVVAPFLAHSATNVGGYAAAVMARRLDRRGAVR